MYLRPHSKLLFLSGVLRSRRTCLDWFSGRFDGRHIVSILLCLETTEASYPAILCLPPKWSVPCKSIIKIIGVPREMHTLLHTFPSTEVLLHAAEWIAFLCFSRSCSHVKLRGTNISRWVKGFTTFDFKIDPNCLVSCSKNAILWSSFDFVRTTCEPIANFHHLSTSLQSTGSPTLVRITAKSVVPSRNFYYCYIIVDSNLN